MLSRYTDEGTLDETFGQSGIVITEVALQSKNDAAKTTLLAGARDGSGARGRLLHHSTRAPAPAKLQACRLCMGRVVEPSWYAWGLLLE